MERFSKKIVIDVFFQISQLNSDLNAVDDTFIDTSTTTIEDMKRFIINCAKSGKKNIRIHNQHSPNLIFGKHGNFLTTMINDGNNNVSCLAINHWNAQPIYFSFSISDGTDNWKIVDINDHKHTVIWLPIEIEIGILNAGQEVFDVEYNFDIPEGYQSCAICGYQLNGNGYTLCTVTAFRVSGSKIVYSVKNMSDLATGDIRLTTSIMCIKNNFAG